MNLDFMWTWAVVPSRLSLLHNEIQTQHALLCSVLAAQKHYPGAGRRFLVCQETYNLLKEKNWLDLWTSVEVLDFPKESAGFRKYYAYPKVWSTRFVERPTIILDVETVPCRYLEVRDKSCVTGPAWRYMIDPEDSSAELELRKWLGEGVGRDFYPSKGNQYIGAWCYYVPSKEAAEYTSIKTCNHIDYILNQVDMRFGAGPACFLEDGYLSHCYEEVCGINFDQSDEWYSSFYHSLGDKWNFKGQINLHNEKKAGLEGVYERYLKRNVRRVV